MSYPRNPVLESVEKGLIIWIKDQIQRRVGLSLAIIQEKVFILYNNSLLKAVSISYIFCYPVLMPAKAGL